MGPIVFVSCGKKKSRTTQQAQDMYEGNYFSSCLQYAKSLTDTKNVYILSAKYGLLHLDTVIDPYELTLNTMSQTEKSAWNSKVIQQFQDEGFDPNQTVISLCGKNYGGCLTYFDKVTCPFDALPKDGMGYRIQFMKSKQTHTVTKKLF